MATLTAAWKGIALKLQERSTETLSHANIRQQLADAIGDKYPDGYCYVIDVYGDENSGDVVYWCGGDSVRAPYELKNGNGVRTTLIGDPVSVVCRTIWDDDNTSMDEDAEGDHIASMEAGLYSAGKIPLCERFISKDERSKMDKGDFAGKGTSFPIKTGDDVDAAARSLSRAGAGNHSPSKIKTNIIAIAKRKGFEKFLPKAWQTDATESKRDATESTLEGEFVSLREGAVGQDGSAYLKLIAPGWGSSGYYSKEVLKRDGPEIFKNGTKAFWNHQTQTEESERPEGDLRDLAAVLTEDAKWDDKGPAGAGLYAKAKVFEQFRTAVDDLAKHIGVSIRAMGLSKEGSAEGRKGPVIEKLTRAISADFVTTPGAGGKVLQLFEAARSAQPISEKESDTMDAVEMKKLVEAAVTSAVAPFVAENKKLNERLTVALEAPTVVADYFRSVRVQDPIRERVTKRAMEAAERYIVDGKLDGVKFRAFVEAETKEEAAFVEKLSGGRIVVNMGAAPAQLTPEQLKEAQTADEKSITESFDDLGSIFLVDSGDKEKNERMRTAFREGRAA